MTAGHGTVGHRLEFLEFSDRANRFVVGLDVGLVGLRLSEQIIGIDRDADPVGPVSGLAGFYVDGGWQARVKFSSV